MNEYLHFLPKETDNIPSPEKFTFPFCYEPHPLCVEAVRQIKDDIRQRFTSLQTSGKMFGVLVVQTPHGRGFLCAFSGILEGSYHHSGFVPPVLDILQPDGYFRKEEKVISDINTRIANLDEDKDKEEIERLKTERKQKSLTLQTWLFLNYEMLNIKGEKKHLLDIFKDYKAPLTVEQYKQKAKPTIGIPPAGSGECCAPKMLQVAFKEGWKPLCMAEFWMGASPKDELRTEGNYYPSCNSKCKPILSHMLIGLDIEENPMIARNRKVAKEMKVLYKDEDIAIISKPSGMLSVPGKEEDLPSVECACKELFPEATGPVIVHRLDMDTSGIMVIALNEEAHKNLQEQFTKHTTRKKYVAIIEDKESVRNLSKEGEISLPLCKNPFDRPRQMVSYEHGKKAHTIYKIGEKTDKGIRVELWPLTGRTHQLRVHCAHHEGLDAPIVGDNLYGSTSDRLYLHAEELTFCHPRTGEQMTFHDVRF